MFGTDSLQISKSPRMPLALALLLLGGAATAAPPKSPPQPVAGMQVDTAVIVTYNALISADAMTSASNIATFRIAQTAGVTLSPTSGAKTTDPGATIYYAVSLTNTGDGTDQYTLSVQAPRGWTTSLRMDRNGDGSYQAGEDAAPVSPLPLGPGQAQALLLAVTPPGRLLDKTVGTVTLSAVSQADSSQSAQASATTTSSSKQPDPPPAPPPPAAPTGPSLAVAWMAQTGGPILGSAAVVGGVAYVGSDDGNLYAIAATAAGAPDAAPGAILWKAATGAPVRGAPAVYAVSGRMQVSVGNEAGRLMTFDAATGQMLWSQSLGAVGTPSLRVRPLISSDGTLITIAAGDGTLNSFDTSSGHLTKRFRWLRGALAGNPALDSSGAAWMMTSGGLASAVVQGVPDARQQLFIGGATASGLTIDNGSSSLIGVTGLGKVTFFDLHTLRALPRSVALNAPVDATPGFDVLGGTLYVATDHHAVYAVKTATGVVQAGGWPFAPSSPGRFTATPLIWPSVQGGAPTLYLGDTGGSFYAIPTDQPGSPLVFTTKQGGSGSAAFGEFDAAPTASGTSGSDVVVVGSTNGLLYGFTLR